MRDAIGTAGFVRALAAAALVLTGAFVLTACRAPDGNGPSEGNERLSVVTSVYPMEYFARRIGGDAVDVVNLVPPGVSAHTFEPSTGDLQRLAAADVVVMNGLALEPWLERGLAALGSNAPRVVIEAADIGDVALLPAEDGHDDGADGEHEELDPHVWLDPLLAVAQVERIRDALVEVAPEHTEAFRTNAEGLIQDLQALHEAFASTLASCRHEHFVTSHAAYGYLARRYGLEQIAIAGLTVEAEPSGQRLAEITDRVRELGLRYILVEPSVGTRLADTVRRETGVELLPIHQIESVTLSELSEHGDYLGLMEDNLSSLATALECGA